MAVLLRVVTETDIPRLWEFERDRAANHMVGFTRLEGPTLDEFTAHWHRLLGNTTIDHRLIEVDGAVAGSIVAFDMEGERNVGYRLGREWWGRGLATEALAAFLAEVTTRPIFGRVVADNVASRRVLEKCGFAWVRTEHAAAEARGIEVEELVLRLV